MNNINEKNSIENLIKKYEMCNEELLGAHELSKELDQLQQISDEKGLQYDIFEYYINIYDSMPSCKKYLREDYQTYVKQMNNKYDLILNCISETIEDSI